MKKQERPEPMALMLRRYDEIEHTYPLTYRKPLIATNQVIEAADVVAQWDLSDPFAFGRTALYLRQGYLEPAEVIKDYHLRTVARRAARIREVESVKQAK